jgi:OmpA-OmpF porin, OOP family
MSACMNRLRQALVAGGLGMAAVWAWAQTAPAPTAAPAAGARERAAPGKVVVSGTVPDEATRQAVLVRAREVFGIDRVVDQLGVGNLVAPPNWSGYVQRIISPDLKQVSRGQINISGNVIELKGEVGNEAVRQQIASQISTQLNTTYTVRNGLRVAAVGQEQVDAALANRIVEFESGTSTLTATGRQVLDQLVPVLQRLPGRTFEVIGHTDAQGLRASNIALSSARAESVKTYLAIKGVPAASIVTTGAGPDRPIAGNDTPDGRARNRRIEFRVVQ